MNKTRPNIFSIVPKELVHDGFFTWLLQWADDSNSQFDQELSLVAKDWVKFFIQLKYNIPNIEIKSVRTWRQWEHIDIIAEINNEFAVIIEDKTNSGEHSEQLERYKEIVNNYYKDSNYKVVFIYLKTGNESLAALKKVKEKDYFIVDRKSILNLFKKGETKNEIFIEFKEYLIEIDNQTDSYNSLENLISNWKAAEGFYITLQERIKEDSDWRYVPNQTGGFLGFWYHWKWEKASEGNLYIQIENAFEYGIKLVVKIDEWEQDILLLHKILADLKLISIRYGLALVKPDRYRAGETSTVAVVENAFPNENKFDVNEFIITLKSLEKTIDEYCQ